MYEDEQKQLLEEVDILQKQFDALKSYLEANPNAKKRSVYDQ